MTKEYRPRATRIGRYFTGLGFHPVRVTADRSLQVSGVLNIRVFYTYNQRPEIMLDRWHRPGWTSVLVQVTDPAIENCILTGRVGDLAPMLLSGLVPRPGEFD